MLQQIGGHLRLYKRITDSDGLDILKAFAPCARFKAGKSKIQVGSPSLQLS
jgi:hypothetical protein